ncbi:MAG: adenine phosphoribosyltransferase [Candidatus Micrarchaeota archaeon]
MDLKEKIRNIPDFPKKGIMFRDITTLLQDARAFNYAVAKMTEYGRTKNVDAVVGIESRGFIFGAVIAHQLGVGFVPVRKRGKLPGEKVDVEYTLEYGTDCVEMHADAFKDGDRVLIVDDLLATGGTAAATAALVEKIGGVVVGMCFLIGLSDLSGIDKLKKYDVFQLVQY